MFCTQCGNAVEPHARFCSRCGHNCESVAAAAPVQQTPKRRDWQMHVNIVGWVFIGSAVLTAVLGLLMMFGGQIVSRLPFLGVGEIPPDVPADFFRFIGSMAGVLGLMTMALAAGIAAAGIGLLQYKEWGRILTILMSVILFFHFPVGTAVAVYALWVLLSEEGRTFFKSRAQSYPSAEAGRPSMSL